MATQRQIEANQRNAAGPHKMSEEGKEAIRANAIRHGLAAKRHIVLRGEDESFFNEIINALLDDYAPANTQEEMLVHQIAEHHWRLLRARAMETAGFELNLDEFAKQYSEDPAKLTPLDHAATLAAGLDRFGSVNATVQRYETAAERSYYRAIRELAKLQKARKQEETRESRSVPQNTQSRQPDPVTTPLPTGEIRSVPKNPKQYTQRDMEMASASMSDKEFDALLDEITAPPVR
jgi:hypothetical protein